MRGPMIESRKELKITSPSGSVWIRKYHVANNRVKIRNRRNELPQRSSRGPEAVEILNGDSIFVVSPAKFTELVVEQIDDFCVNGDIDAGKHLDIACIET